MSGERKWAYNNELTTMSLLQWAYCNELTTMSLQAWAYYNELIALSFDARWCLEVMMSIDVDISRWKLSECHTQISWSDLIPHTLPPSHTPPPPIPPPTHPPTTHDTHHRYKEIALENRMPHKQIYWHSLKTDIYHTQICRAGTPGRQAPIWGSNPFGGHEIGLI